MTVDYNRTFIGIDYGRRRIGIAKSDPTGLIASAIRTLEVKSQENALSALGEVIDEFEPDGLVFGYPIKISGNRGALCDEIDAVIKNLMRVYDIPVHLVDERYTSQEAADIIHDHGKRIGQDKRRVDRLAATLILQRFLDEHPR